MLSQRMRNVITTAVMTVVVAWTNPCPTTATNSQDQDPPTGQESESVQEKEDESPSATFERQIVVTAAEPDLLAEDRIETEELKDQPAGDLGEALRRQPGLSAVRRGPINLDPVVRGLQENQVAVLVDGTRTFAAGPARMDSDLAHVSLDALERLAIVKGPYALTWGAGALAAIRAETLRPAFQPTAGWGGEVHGGWTENGSASDGSATVFGSGDRFRFALTASDQRGDDYTAGDGSEVQADFSSTGVRWSLGFRPRGTEGPILEYTGGYQEQHDIDYPGRILDATYFYTRSHAVELHWEKSAGVLREVEAQVYTNRKDHLMNNDEKPTAQPNPARIPPFAIDVDLPTESNTAGGRFHVALGGGALRWKLGGDHYTLDQNAQRTVSRRDNGVVLFEDTVWPDARIRDTGLYVQVIRARSALDLSGTVRVDMVDADAQMLSPFFLANTTGDAQQDETNWSAALSARWRSSGRWVVFGGIGRAVRSPSVLERYSDRFPSTRFQVAAEFLGNPGLRPEASHQIDLGTEANLGAGIFSVELFYRVIDDYITVEPDPSLPRRLPLSPPTVFRYVNGDRATYWGGELELRRELGPRLLARLAASYVWGKDETFDEPAFGVPPLTAEGSLRWQTTNRLWLEGALTWADRQDRVATRRLEQPTPGHTVVNLRASWTLTDPLELELGVWNLFDETYSDHLDSLNPFAGERVLERGRAASMEVRYRF